MPHSSRRDLGITDPAARQNLGTHENSLRVAFRDGQNCLALSTAPVEGLDL